MDWKYVQVHFVQATERPRNGSRVETVCGRQLMFPGPEKDGTTIPQACDRCTIDGALEEGDPEQAMSFEVIEQIGRPSL